MLLRQDIDIIKFLQQVKRCRDEVLFETTEGDRMNLTSTLSQYVFCSIASHPEYWTDSTITCKNTEDYQLLTDYLYERNA